MINNNNSTSTSTSTSNTDDIATPSLAPSSSSSQFTPPLTNRVVDSNAGATIPSSFIEVAVLMLLVMFCMLRNWQIQKRKQNEDNNGSSRRRLSITRTSGHSSVHPSSRTAALGSGIQLLSLENCIELYNKTFDSNGNQLILQKKHIITKTMKGNGNDNDNNNNDNGATEGAEQNNRNGSFVDIELGDDTNCKDDDDDDDDSIYLSFESDRNICSSNQSIKFKFKNHIYNGFVINY